MARRARGPETRRFVLWDVDGTLVSCGPSGREALELGACRAGGLDSVPHLPMGGKTDPQILGEMLRGAGVAPADIGALIPVGLAEAERVLAGWRERMGREGRVHPGVRSLLGELAGRGGIRQTLLTGNVAVNAAVKVGAFGLDGFFDLPVGAYGDDHAERDFLVPIALGRARQLRDETYAADQVWVIGDTARDLSCARAAGVRCLIVGTGHDGFDAVRDLEADAVLENLADAARVLRILLAEATAVRSGAYDLAVTDRHPLSEQEFWEIYSKVPRLTVEVVVTGARGVLLTRRAIEPCRGMWHLPGGTVRFGERLAEAVRRVARRELGIEVLESRMLGCIEYPSHYENGLDSPVGVAHLITRHSGTIETGPEASDHGWFRRLPAEMHPEQVRFLEEAGLADAGPDGAESPDIHSRRTDSGD